MTVSAKAKVPLEFPYSRAENDQEIRIKETLINDLNKNPDWKYFCFFEPVTAKTRKRLLF